MVFFISSLIWKWVSYGISEMNWEKLNSSIDIKKLITKIQTLENKIGVVIANTIRHFFRYTEVA